MYTHWRIYIVKFWMHAPPPPRAGIQILSFSCSFWRNLAKLCVHAPPPLLAGSRPHLGEILDPPLTQLESFLYHWFLCLEFRVFQGSSFVLHLLLLAEYSEIFNHLDPGSTGSLSRDEFMIALRLAGHNPTRDDIDQLLVHKPGNAFVHKNVLVFSYTIQGRIQDFCRRGRQHSSTPGGGGGGSKYNFYQSFQKLHEIEKILIPRGALTRGAPLDPPLPLADLTGCRDIPHPASKFFRFHAIFRKIWQNCVLATRPPPPLPRSLRRHLGEIMDPPL